MPGSLFQGPYGLRSGWRLLIFLSLAVTLLFLFGAGLGAAGFGMRFGHEIPSALMLAAEGLLFLCPLFAAWIMTRLEHKTFFDYGLPPRGAFGRNFWAGAAIGLTALTLLLIVIRLSHGFYFGRLGLDAKGTLKFGVIWAATFIVVALAEEFLFRGYALTTLSEGIGFWPAAILLSAAFGAVHLLNPDENSFGVLGAALLGLLFCFTFRRSGSLWFAIGLHAGWDYGESFIYSVPNSGTMIRGHLLNSSFVYGAPAWLTGGTVGPEGSVFVFVVLGTLFLVVDRMFPQTHFPPRAASHGPSASQEANPVLT